MTDPINTLGKKYISVDQDAKFEKGDIINFVLVDYDAEMKDISSNNLIGLVNKVEDRYITIFFSMEPVEDGKVSHLNLNMEIVVKMNGYSKTSIATETGVATVNLPLADVVNSQKSIIIKSMFEREK